MNRFASTRAAFAVLGLLVAGCATPEALTLTTPPPAHPANVFLDPAFLAADLKRVAVLQVSCDSRDSDRLAARDAFGPVLQNELIQTRKFEVISVSAEVERRLTGQPAWNAAELLPEDFFTTLNDHFACDAVLFSELTTFRAYPPLAVGWRLRLVDTRSHRTLWAVDELFDAADPAVTSAARRYFRNAQPAPGRSAATADWVLVNSPRAFGQYAVAEVLNTLPAR